jgi:hypothetical protein
MNAILFPGQLQQAIAQVVATTEDGSTEQGTGFLAAPTLLLTAYHVVKDAVEVAKIGQLHGRHRSSPPAEPTYGPRILTAERSYSQAPGPVGNSGLSPVPCPYRPPLPGNYIAAKRYNKLAPDLKG